MKKLPIGIQSFRELIEGGYTYVDKTELIYKLINSNKYYFLSRPRRFGKSLLLSTLEEIFNGNQDLFEDCFIHSSDHPWQKHPVVHFDFTQIPTQNLEKGLFEALDHIAKGLGVTLSGSSLQLRLVSLIEQLGSAVVLVDEYDKPIIDNLSSNANRDLLRNFFGTLKSLDRHLKLVFITGVSKFSQVSLFSGFNNLKDITLRKEFATLCGYTQEEIIRHFNPDPEILDTMRTWYNGYKFAAEGTPVYNPFSTLNFLDEGETQSYWYRTGTPTFLVDEIRKRPSITTSLSGALSTAGELLDIRSIEHIDLKALMWQTGYLTLADYDPTTQLYTLDFPNKEVRSAFFNSLIKEFAQIDLSAVIKNAQAALNHLHTHNLKDFFALMNAHLAKIPYNLTQSASEGFYHAIFLSLLESMGLRVRAEEQTNTGRIDLVCELPQLIYIFEFKHNQDAQIALDQIKRKHYSEKYSATEKDLALVGVNFNASTRNISDWKAHITKSSGELIKELHALYHTHAKG